MVDFDIKATLQLPWVKRAQMQQGKWQSDASLGGQLSKAKRLIALAKPRGRPGRQDEPVKVMVTLPRSLLARIDAGLGDKSRSGWIEAALLVAVDQAAKAPKRRRKLTDSGMVPR